jgi:hypothetical protein
MATGTENVLDERDETLRIINGDSRDDRGPTYGYVLCLCHPSILHGQLSASAAARNAVRFVL